MAKDKSNGLVKVKANYETTGDTVTLWGFKFNNDGEGSFITELSEDDAENFINAGLVTKL